MPLLSEVARRRASFDPVRSAPVVFADGQDWFLTRPPDDPDLDVFIFLLAQEWLEDDDRIRVVATIAAALLQLNYELSEDELDSLICIKPTDLESIRWIRGVVDVATYRTGRAGE